MLSSAIIYGGLAGARSAGTFAFPTFKYDQFAWGVANAVASWAIGQPQNVTLIGAAVGTVGAGVVVPVTSKVLVPSSVALMLSALQGAGYNGPLAPSLAASVSVGIATSFTASAQYTGPVAGVGVGQDVSKVVVANAASLIPLLDACIGGSMGHGVLVPSLATGLANGITRLLLLGTGTGTVAGAPGPSPGTGVSTSVLV